MLIDGDIGWMAVYLTDLKCACLNECMGRGFPPDLQEGKI